MVIRGMHEMWLGHRFREWCECNEYDGTIHYMLSGFWQNKPQQMKFSSNGEIDGLTMHVIRNSEIRWLEWIDGEPYFHLWFEDVYAPYIKADVWKNLVKN